MKYDSTKRALNWKINAIFIVTGTFIGMFLTVQFKSAIPSATFLSDQLKVQKELVDSYLNDQGVLKTKIITLRNQIDEAQQKASQYVKTANLETLNSLKEDIGLQTVTGLGVIISLDDGMFLPSEILLWSITFIYFRLLQFPPLVTVNLSCKE